MGEARGRLHTAEHGLLGGPEGGLQNLLTVVSTLANVSHQPVFFSLGTVILLDSQDSPIGR